MQILSQKFCEHSVSIKGYARKTIVRYKQVIGFYCRFANVNDLSEVSTENLRSLFYYGRTERINYEIHFYITINHCWYFFAGVLKINTCNSIQ